MKIPRFAFISMLLLILFLSGGLALLRARGVGHAGGSVLVLTFKVLPGRTSALLPEAITRDCVITTDQNLKTGQCGYRLGLNDGINDGILGVMFRFISRDGDRTEVGVKATFKSHSTSFAFVNDLNNVRERVVPIEPGQEEQVTVPDLGAIEISGQYLDHAPLIWEKPSETLQPQKGEFRVVDPVLIGGNQVVCDMSNNGLSISNGDPDAALMMYCPGQGAYLVSKLPFEGATEGIVKMGQIRFKFDGVDYLLLSAMPIIRAEHVWVSHDPQFRISEHLQGASDDRPYFMVRSLKLWLQTGVIRNID